MQIGERKTHHNPSYCKDATQNDVQMTALKG